MSDFSCAEKIDRILSVFPEYSDLRVKFTKQICDMTYEYKVIHLNAAFGMTTSNYRSDRKVLFVYSKSNQNRCVTFAEGKLFTREQIEFLQFFDIDIDQREHSLAFSVTGEDLLTLSHLVHGRLWKNPEFIIRSMRKLIAITPDKSVADMIAEMRSSVLYPVVQSRVEDYLDYVEMREVYDALLSLEAEGNTVAIALHNILDEGELRRNRRKTSTNL